MPTVVAMENSVVAEQSPVVAGSAADSDEAAPSDRISYCRALSHIAPGATTDQMEEVDWYDNWARNNAALIEDFSRRNDFEDENFNTTE